MDRNPNPLQRIEKVLDGIRQLVGRGGKSHQRGSDDQQGKPDGHFHSKGKSLFCDLQKGDPEELFAGCQKQVKSHCDQQQDQDRFHTTHNISDRNIRKFDHGDQKDSTDSVADKRIHHKKGDNVYQCPNDLDPGVKPVKQ